MDDLQNDFALVLDSLNNRGLEVYAQEVITKSSTDPENSEYLVLRTLEDFAPGMDTKLRRRVVDSPKFRPAIQEIRRAIADGAFVINVVAPEYTDNKDLVDLVVLTALTDPPKHTKAASLEDVESDKKARNSKVNANIIRDINVPKLVSNYGNQVGDAAVALSQQSFFGGDYFNPNDSINCLYPLVKDYERDPNPDAEAQRAGQAGAARRQHGQPGAPEETGEIAPSERELGRRGRSPMNYMYESDPHDAFDFEGEGAKKVKHNVSVANPMTSTPEGVSKEGAETPPAVYFDERASRFLRFDPKNPNSYIYPFLSTEVKQVELDARNRMTHMIDTGFGGRGNTASQNLRQKWMTMAKMLAAIQGTRPVSIFHPSGFDADGNPRPIPAPEPGRPANNIPLTDVRVNDNVVRSLVEEFLGTIGIRDDVLSGGISDAAIGEMTGGKVQRPVEKQPAREEEFNLQTLTKRISGLPTSEASQVIIVNIANAISKDPNMPPAPKQRRVVEWITNHLNEDWARDWNEAVWGYLRINAEDRPMAKAERKDIFVKRAVALKVDGCSEQQTISRIAYVAAIEVPVNRLKKHTSLTTWIAERFGEEYRPYSVNVFGTLKMVSMNFSDVDGDYIKEAATESILGSEFFQRLDTVIREHHKMRDTVSQPLSAEYVLVRLINFIERKCSESYEVNVADLSRTGVKGVEKVQPGDYSVVVPLDAKTKAALNITSVDDFNSSFPPISRGAVSPDVIRKKMLISNGDGSVHEVATVAHAQILDSLNRKMSFPERGEVEGAKLEIAFNPSLRNKYDAGDFYIAFYDEASGVEGTHSELYAGIYGGNADKVRKLHKENGVELALSIYPPWAPAQFDYRPTAENGAGHPNNAYALKQALQDRIALREQYLRQSEHSEVARMQLEEPIALVEQEIGQMQMYLNSYAAQRYVKSRGNPGDVDRSRSMSRGTERVDAPFFEEVKRRCLAEGVDIGPYGPVFKSEVLRSVLTDRQFATFSKINASVKREMGERRNVFIVRGIDHGADTQGTGNGFLIAKRDQEKGKVDWTWSSRFEGAVKGLHGLVAGQAGRAGASLSAQRSHILLISESPVPNLVEEPVVVRLATNTMGFDEMYHLFRFYEMQEKQRVLSRPNVKNLPATTPDGVASGATDEVKKAQVLRDRALSFTIPMSFIRKAQRILSDLGFQKIDEFIQEKVREIFEQYMKIGNIIKIMDANSSSYKSQMDELRLHDSEMQRMGIECKPASVSLKDYVTQAGSAWDTHVTGTVKDIVGQLKENDNRLDFLRRVLDTGLYFGTFEIVSRAVEGGKQQNVVRFALPTENTPGTIVWFDGTAKILPNVGPDGVMRELALWANYGVNTNLYTELMSNPAYASYHDQNTVNVMKDRENIAAYKAAVSARIEELENSSRGVKVNYPNLVMVEGSAGTGKSIYAEVLAHSLDCKYLKTTFENICYSGDPKYRGEVEKNVARFLSTLRTLTDTVILIDEIDKFLIAPGVSDGSIDVARTLTALQVAWEDDISVYHDHNLHIVCTTNYWSKIKDSHGALASRFKEVFNVPLPSNLETLKAFFIGDAVQNNLMNAVCGADPVVVEQAKTIIKLWGSTNASDQATVKMLREKIEATKPGFFAQYSILRPAAAANSWAASKKLDVVRPVDVVQDFVNGWRLVPKIFHDMLKDTEIQVVGTDGQAKSENIQPLEVALKHLSEIMVYQTESFASEKGENKVYARTSMRELMFLLEDMFKSHQKFLSGETSLPINWKTFLLMVKFSSFKGSIDVNMLPQEDRDDATLMSQIQNANSVNGFSALKRYLAGDVVPSRDLPPFEAWLTDEELAQRSSNEIGLVAESNIDGGDGGWTHLMDKIAKGFKIGNSGFDTQLSILTEAVSRQTANKQKSAAIVGKFVQLYSDARTQLAEHNRAFFGQPDGAAKTAAFSASRSLSNNIVSNYNIFVRKASAQINEFFSIEQRVHQTWMSINSGVREMEGAFRAISVLERTKEMDPATYVQDTKSKIFKQTERALNLTQNATLKLFAPLVFGDRKMDKARFDLISKGLSQSDDFEFLTPEETDAGVQDLPDPSSERPAEVSEQEVGELVSSDAASYTSKAMSLGLHVQVFNAGDVVRVLHPKFKDHSTSYTVEAVQVDKKYVRRENPRGIMVTLSGNAGTWEPKDLTSSVPAAQPSQAVPPVPQPKAVPDAKKPAVPPVAPPTKVAPTNAPSPLAGEKPDAFDNVDLGIEPRAARRNEIKTSTDYFYQYLKENWTRKAQDYGRVHHEMWKDKSFPPATKSTSLDGVILNANWTDLAQAFSNREKMRCEVGRYPHIVQSSAFFEQVHLFGDEKTQPSSPELATSN